ncbi:MAG: hypothetical protein ACOYJE_09830 [Bacteroidaceae bacterium]|jgi:hypothetical protein
MNSKVLSEKLIDLFDKLSAWNRFQTWEKLMKSKASHFSHLTKGQVHAIKSYYHPYKDICTDAHSFYTGATGNFHVNYIPDALWYAFIEPYYNPRRLAKSLDSKCLYERLLRGGIF